MFTKCLKCGVVHSDSRPHNCLLRGIAQSVDSPMTEYCSNVVGYRNRVSTKLLDAAIMSVSDEIETDELNGLTPECQKKLGGDAE